MLLNPYAHLKILPSAFICHEGRTLIHTILSQNSRVQFHKRTANESLIAVSKDTMPVPQIFLITGNH